MDSKDGMMNACFDNNRPFFDGSTNEGSLQDVVASPTDSPSNVGEAVMLGATSFTPDLLEALRAIPPHEKVYYSYALRVAPHLVELESDPIAFLRYCDWNAKAAARRLTVYWQKRVEVFGETRAFLPLDDFSGNGALGSEEIEILRSGAYCLLPKDAHGRSICYFDRSTVPPLLLHNTNVKVRACFAVLQKMAPNCLGGCVLVIRGLQTTDNDNIARYGLDLLHEALPLRVSAIHIVYIREERNGFRQSIIPFLLTHFGRFFSDKLQVHDCESAEQLVMRMAKHGISRDSLPPRMGGFAKTDGTADSSFSDPLFLSACVETTNADSGVAGAEYHPQEGHPAKLSTLYAVATPAPATNADDFDSLNDVFGALDGSQIGNMKRQSSSKKLSALVSATTHTSATSVFPGFSGNFHSLEDAFGSADSQRGSLNACAGGDLGSTLDGIPVRSPITAQKQQQLDNNHLGSERTHFAEIPGVPVFGQIAQALQKRAPPTLGEFPATCTDGGGGGGDDPLDIDTASFSGTAGANDNAPFDHGLSEPTPVPAEPATNNPHSALLDQIFHLVETSGVLEPSLAALNAAMNRLPHDKQAAYAEAVRRAPAVVQAESAPGVYLQLEKSNAWAAAKRLALYWRNRVQYFGDEAFLPLTQTRPGPLREEDLWTLSAGPFFFLPNDSSGRPVLCLDPSKCPDDTSKASLVRVAMYFFSILLCDNLSALMTEGCLVLVFVSNRIVGLPQNEAFREAIDVALDSFPLKKCETHIICSPEQSPTLNPRERSFFKFALPVLQRTIGRLLCLDRVHFHVGTREELESKLVACCLSGAVLRAAINGGIESDDFARWMKNRQLFELQRHCRHSQQPGNQHQPPSLPPTVTQGTTAGTTDRNKSPSESRGATPPANQHDDVTGALELVATSEKDAYLEAVKEVPDLVRKESDPILFLKLENYDAVAAAKRLAKYWRIRRKIFGERALLAMDQTGDGALCRRDVTLLQTGFLTQLPNELSGHSVVCCDGSRVEKPSPASQLRVFFYLWSVLSQNDLSQTDGYTVLYTMAEPSFDKSCKKCLDLVMEAHPVKLKCLHLLGCTPGGTSESDFRLGPVEATMNLLLDRSDQEKVVVHICESRGDFSSILVNHGMSKDGLPRAFGGKWGSDDFLQWQELRIRNEWDLPIPSSAKKFAESYLIPCSTLQRPSSLNDEEQTERKRRLNVVHSRRKRERARIEVQLWQEQCSALREERQRLLRKGRELECLLRRAKAIVASSSTHHPFA